MATTAKSRANDDTETENTVIEVDGAAGKRLKSFIERIERLEEEKAGLATDIKDIYAEAKSTGFDVKAIRTIVRLRKIDEEKRAEAEAILETYKAAIGMG
jgi:uncharacterized protein (UPF0335 family)